MMLKRQKISMCLVILINFSSGYASVLRIGQVICNSHDLRDVSRENFSNIDFFLKILPLKDDELVMSEM